MLDPRHPFAIFTAQLRERAHRGQDMTQDDIARAIREAYMEGFGDGADHGNLSYKYPPINLAWMTSSTRHKLRPDDPVMQRVEWYRNGDVTDIELPEGEV